MSFTGGKLTLKGGVDPLKLTKKNKKKKKKMKDKDLDAVLNVVDDEVPPVQDTPVVENTPVVEDRRTEAEKRRDAHMRKYEEERARKAAAKSHRQRIEEFNSKLATLTEHHDIPKISYSYM